MTHHPVVRAIDVGYGNTKFILEHVHRSPMICSAFPSLAPQASKSAELSSGVFQQRQTCRVVVDGVEYEVGRDSRLAQDASYNRNLDPNYSESNQYMALLRGALAHMGVDEIDVLALGLPVNNVGKFQSQLIARVTGEHCVPNLDAPGQSRTVLVREVKVFPQPLGAFFDYAIRKGMFGRMRGETNLVIDPGYFTFDWLLANGVKVVDTRSGAVNGGMSSVLAAMAESIGPKIGTPITDLTILDDALRNKRPPRFFGKEYAIENELALAKDKARQFVAAMANRVGSGLDVDNIILAGGGAEFFHDLVAKAFPKHEIIVSDEPIYANVRGFHLAATQYAESEAFKIARSRAA